MKRWLAMVAMAAMILSPGAVCAQDRPPDATLALTGRQFALGLGIAWRGGTLEYQGRRLAIAINGLAICDVGVATVDATAEIFGLTDLAAFDGTYVPTAAALPAANGSAFLLRNHNGVVLRVRSLTPGLRLKEPQAAVTLSIAE